MKKDKVLKILTPILTILYIVFVVVALVQIFSRFGFWLVVMVGVTWLLANAAYAGVLKINNKIQFLIATSVASDSLLSEAISIQSRNVTALNTWAKAVGNYLGFSQEELLHIAKSEDVKH